MIWVIDASVAVKWFFVDEPEREQALALRRHLASEPRLFAAPHLLMSEMIHVLARKSGSDRSFLAAAGALMLRLGLRTVGLSEHGWARAAHWCARGLSGYDATYVALAEELNGRWVTADLPASRKAGRLAIALGEWE